MSPTKESEDILQRVRLLTSSKLFFTEKINYDAVTLGGLVPLKLGSPCTLLIVFGGEGASPTSRSPLAMCTPRFPDMVLSYTTDTADLRALAIRTRFPWCVL